MNKKYPIHVDAIVILPDHIHAIWTLPDDDDHYSIRRQLFKSIFSSLIPKDQHAQQSKSRIEKRELGVWQRRFWEHRIRDEEDFQRHVDYIHHNPVKHGYVSQVQDWEFSTFHREVKLGKYMLNWANDVGDWDGD